MGSTTPPPGLRKAPSCSGSTNCIAINKGWGIMIAHLARYTCASVSYLETCHFTRLTHDMPVWLYSEVDYRGSQRVSKSASAKTIGKMNCTKL